MARRYLPVNEVVEGVKGWTVLAQVVERGHVQLSRGARPVNYRRFLLTDSEGTKVSAVIYGNDIRFFAGMLMPFRRYYISSAALRKAESRYKVSDYPYSWVIHNRTLVEEYVEQVPPVIPCHFELTAFENLFKFADTENLQNIQGIVVHTFPSREQGLDSTTRDLVVVNQEKRPMLLTLWNEFEANEGAQLANTIANNNIIIAMRVKVTTFNYLSLTTRLASCLLVNPPTPEATILRQWYDQNRQEIAQLIEQTSYKDSTKLLPPSKNDDIISVENAVSMLKNVKTAWIRGNTSLAAEQRSFWYAACSNCQKAVDANLEWIIRCPSCREESAVEARCRIGIIIDDGTSSMYAVVFGPDAEKLIPFTAVQLSEADEHGVEVFSEIASAIDNREVLCFVRHFDSDYQRQKDDKYSIVKIYTVEELAEINPTITRIVVSNPVEEPVPTALTITEKPTSTIEQVDLTARSTFTGQLATEEQFFSPTTKMILDSIGRKSDNADKPASSNIAAKRSLTFETPPSAEKKTAIEAVPSIARKNGPEDKKPASSKSAHMSPLKKQRESAK